MVLSKKEKVCMVLSEKEKVCNFAWFYPINEGLQGLIREREGFVFLIYKESETLICTYQRRNSETQRKRKHTVAIANNGS